MVVCIAAIAFLGLMPSFAHALDVPAFTARSNQDAGGIMGAAPTRVTIDVQTQGDEQLKSITFEFAEGVHFDIDDVKTTGLSGLNRLDFDIAIIPEGDRGFTVSFEEPTPKDLLIKTEIYDLSFPGDGGTFTIGGTYVLADGSSHPLPQAPSVEVSGVSVPEQISAWLGQQPWVMAWNESRFLHLFFDPTIIVTSIPVVFQGWLKALGFAAISFPLAIPVGLALAFLRMSKSRILRVIGSAYVNVVRGTPLFLQIYIAFFGLPLLGFDPGLDVLSVLVLLFNSSAYLAEIFRAGIQSINKGQFEAARSLGMNGFQTMFSVVIPQTIRRVMPTMTSEFILLYKDTSLLAAVSVLEIMTFSKSIVATTGNMTPYIVAACFYLIVTLPLAKIIGSLEIKLAAKDSGASTKKKRGKEKSPITAPEAALRTAAVSAGYAASVASVEEEGEGAIPDRRRGNR